jgi:NAD(P)-dependent dehydrogenase (short-subunit alcohol dehydrogenase family)
MRIPGFPDAVPASPTPESSIELTSNTTPHHNMARILITGSSDGLGSAVAQRLISRGHSVVLHARNAERAKDATAAAPGAEAVVTGDLSSISSTKALAAQVNDLGTFDCVIHNAGLYHGGFRKTSDGIPALAAVNIVAPYILAASITRPKRLIFVSSEMHRTGAPDTSDFLWTTRGESAWDDTKAYCESKFNDILLAKVFARRWPDVKSNALDPGWIATKMGGSSATGDLERAIETYVMLAEGEEEDAKKSGLYFRPGKQESQPEKEGDSEKLQDQLLNVCEQISGVTIQ